MTDWRTLEDDRLGALDRGRAALDYPVRGGAAIGHALGVALVVLFLGQCVTGALLALFYSPSVTDAWASVAYIETTVAAGAVVRGIHHFGTGAMVVLAALHASFVVVRGAYRAPREPTWWVGLALLGLVLAYPITGYTLVWDQLGYWASKVRSGITASVPLMGPLLQDLALGGNDHGNLTLTRTYALHVVVLPALTTALIVAHVGLFLRKGYTPAASRGSAAQAEPYGARQVAYDLALAGAALGLVGALGMAFGAPLGAPADPTESFIARPEWYFLPLFQLLKYFDGPLQVVGTVVVPSLVAGFLVALPLLDRGPDGRVRARLPWVGGFFGLLAGMGGLATLAVGADRVDPAVAEHRLFSAREAARALELARAGIPPEGAAAVMNRDPLARGERVFRKRCRSCHALEGIVPEEAKGPDLTAYGSKAWLRQLLRDPDGPRFFGRTKKIDGMPSFAELDDARLGLLVDFLHSLRLREGIDVEDYEHHDLLVEQECEDCHDFADRYAVEGPHLVGYLSKEWIRAMVDHPGASELYGAMNEMPGFATRLPESDREALVVFLQSLEARADLRAWPYLDEPAPTARAKTSTRARGRRSDPSAADDGEPEDASGPAEPEEVSED